MVSLNDLYTTNQYLDHGAAPVYVLWAISLATSELDVLLSVMLQQVASYCHIQGDSGCGVGAWNISTRPNQPYSPFLSETYDRPFMSKSKMGAGALPCLRRVGTILMTAYACQLHRLKPCRVREKARTPRNNRPAIKERAEINLGSKTM